MSKFRIVGSVALGAALAVLVALTSGSVQGRSASRSDYEELALLADVMHMVDQYYVQDVERHELVQGAVRGILETLDPHSSYLDPQLYDDIQQDTRGEFEGLGIEITKLEGNGFVMVVAPIDGTPAQRAGIRARDQIVAVCPDATETSCKSTQKMDLLQAVKLMRGRRGTQVMVKVAREGWNEPRPFIIKRDSIQVTSVSLQMIEPGMPYVRMSQFQERTARDLKEALDRAREAGEIQGLVLDLRDNPGGLLEQAVEVADLFMDEGLIIASEGRGGGNRMEWRAHRPGTEPGYPMVVLVNGGSASAAEIVAGALQDTGRAVLMGTQTFGKGSVQTIIPLDGHNGGLRLTTAFYYLPSGRSIQEVRIQPNILAEPYSEAMVEAIEKREERETFGEADLEGHLTGEEARAEAPKSDGDPKREAFERALRVDFPLSYAIDVLKSQRVFSNLLGSGAKAS